MTLASAKRIQPRTPAWVRYLDHRLPGETPMPGDDFFSDGIKTGITELTVSGSASWTERLGVLSVEYANQTTDDCAVALRALGVGSPPATIETAFSAENNPDDFNIIGLCFTNGVTATDSVAMVRRTLATTAAAAVDRVSAGTLTSLNATVNVIVGANTRIHAMNQGIAYLRLNWTAANSFTAWFSSDGVHWTRHSDTDSTFSFTMTPTHFGPIVSTSGDVNEQMATFHYLRVYPADLS